MDPRIETPKRNPKIQLKQIGPEALLYDSGDKSLHVLNPTALTIWQLCDGEHSVTDMETIIRDKFHVSEEVDIFLDIQKTLELFVTKSLLTKG